MRKTKFFKAICGAAVMLCLISGTATAYALDYVALTSPQTFWANTSSITLSLTFSNGTANCGVKVDAISGTSSITGTVTLERKNSNGTYTAVKTWDSLSSPNATLTFSGSQSVQSGYTYRLSVSANVTRNGVTESANSSVENSL